HRWLGRGTMPARLADVNDRHVRQLPSIAGERPPPDVAEAPPNGVGRLDVRDEEGFFEPRSARDHVALFVEHERVTVEDQLVLTADGVAEGDKTGVVAGACCEHLLALAVAKDMERRR